MEKKILLPKIKLKKIKRDRHSGFEKTTIANVMYSYLFDGKSNRAIDREILEIDDKKSHGYISMGILHDFCLTAEVKGCCQGFNIEDVIVAMEKREDYAVIRSYLELLRAGTNIKLPELNKSDRKGEYSKYSNQEIHDVVYQYLFEGKSHRKLDTDVLKLDSSKSKGYQAMSILHFLGLDGKFKGLFKGKSIEDAIDDLNDAGIEYKLVKDILELKPDNNTVVQTTEDNIIVLHISDYSMHKSKTKF